MEVTAEPVREECLKGLLNGEAVFALVRSQYPLAMRASSRASVTRTGSHLDSSSWCRAPPVDDRDEPLAGFTTVLRVQLSWVKGIADEPARSRGAYRGSPTSTVGLVSIRTLKLP
jgi:hypothetical protein